MQNNGARPKDELYKLYGANAFEQLVIDENVDPELAKFVNETITKGPKFSNYASEKLNQFVSRIYELRKDNPNNTAG
jgi:hypothetical protein